MQIAKKTCLAAALVFALSGQAMAEDVTADTVVATVGGFDITVGHMIVAKSSLPQQYQTLPDESLFPGLLDQLIQQTALAQSIEVEPPQPRLKTSLSAAKRCSMMSAKGMPSSDPLTQPDVIESPRSRIRSGGSPARASGATVRNTRKPIEIPHHERTANACRLSYRRGRIESVSAHPTPAGRR